MLMRITKLWKKMINILFYVYKLFLIYNYCNFIKKKSASHKNKKKFKKRMGVNCCTCCGTCIFDIIKTPVIHAC